MKLLLDENISPKLTLRLADLYPGSVSVLGQGWGGQTDQEVFLHALDLGLTGVSHDRDFESLALLHPGGKVILLTGGNLSTTETERLLRLFFEQIEAFGLDSSQQVLELR